MIEAIAVSGFSSVDIQSKMEYEGFVDVMKVIYSWPLNDWLSDKKLKELGKDSISTRGVLIYILGKYSYQNMGILKALKDRSMRLFIKVLKMTEDEVLKLLKEVHDEMGSRCNRAY